MQINIGLKQGDALSIILLNIYINNFPGRLLEDSRFSGIRDNTPDLENTKIQNLLLAKEGLQKNINIRTI